MAGFSWHDRHAGAVAIRPLGMKAASNRHSELNRSGMYVIAWEDRSGWTSWAGSYWGACSVPSPAVRPARPSLKAVPDSPVASTTGRFVYTEMRRRG
jgi:hypothetical protein